MTTAGRVTFPDKTQEDPVMLQANVKVGVAVTVNVSVKVALTVTVREAVGNSAVVVGNTNGTCSDEAH